MVRIRIGEFVKLTGTTLKTVKYYHKIGLLPEPERSEGDYRLYGPQELNRMRLIQHLKSLGLDLQQIKATAGDSQKPASSLEVLQSLRRELVKEIKILEERVAKIDTLIDKNTPLLDGDSFDPPSFQSMTETLSAEQMEQLAGVGPEFYAQHRRVHGILNDFRWGEDYEQTFSDLTAFFKDHPGEYQIALDYAARLNQMSDLDPDDPQIDVFTRESAELIKTTPMLKEILFRQKPIRPPLASVYNELVTEVMPPARIQFNKLLQKHLGLDIEGKD